MVSITEMINQREALGITADGLLTHTELSTGINAVVAKFGDDSETVRMQIGVDLASGGGSVKRLATAKFMFDAGVLDDDGNAQKIDVSAMTVYSIIFGKKPVVLPQIARLIAGDVLEAYDALKSKHQNNKEMLFKLDENIAALLPNTVGDRVGAKQVKSMREAGQRKLRANEDSLFGDVVGHNNHY